MTITLHTTLYRINGKDRTIVFNRYRDVSDEGLPACIAGEAAAFGFYYCGVFNAATNNKCAVCITKGPYGSVELQSKTHLMIIEVTK